MMGFEPTTFCMASASDVRARSRMFAQTACLQRLRPSERTQPNPSERRTLPFLPRLGRRAHLPNNPYLNLAMRLESLPFQATALAALRRDPSERWVQPLQPCCLGGAGPELSHRGY